MLKKAAVFIFLAVLLAVPALAQTQFFLATDANGTIPTGTVEILTPAELPFWANLVWAGHEGEEFAPVTVSFHYEIWGTGYPGDFLVEQIQQPRQTMSYGVWTPWAIVNTDKPNCTYFNVWADIQGPDMTSVMLSNVITFHLNDVVPEPSSFLALGTGLMGLAGFVIRRRK